jgi:hypothetical protein
VVLFVDDERPLVLLGEEMLAEIGYEPIGFDRSPAALAAFRADPDRFDLVLTDDIMPGVTGTQRAAGVCGVSFWDNVASWWALDVASAQADAVPHVFARRRELGDCAADLAIPGQRHDEAEKSGAGSRAQTGRRSSVERLVSPLPGRKGLSRRRMESMMTAVEPASGESRLKLFP